MRMRIGALSLLVMLALTGCSSASRTPPTTAVAKPAAPRVVFGRTVRVSFTGNRAVTSEDLRAVMQIDKAPDGNERAHADELRDVLARDLLLLSALYYDRGHIMVQIDSPDVTEAKDGPFLDVVVRVKVEGPRFRIGRISIYERGEDGAVAAPLDGIVLRKYVSLADGSFFARDVLVRDLGVLRTYYRDRGYANVEIEPETELDEPRAKVDIVMPIRRGPLVHVERIEIDAPPELVPTLRRELQLAPGAPFHETKLEESRRRMIAASRLRRIEISTKPGADDEHVVVLFEAVR